MLYIVGTPIGNLEDLSLRQAKAIASAKTLLTEDTRSTGFVLQKIPELFSIQVNPSQRLISYYKENEFEKLPEIMEMLQNDEEIALISQAGMPLISDPGYLLVKTAIKERIPFTVIPGPTAATTALVLSGCNPAEHMFLGFLPKTTPGVCKVVKKLQSIRSFFPEIVFVLYESPHRIQKTLRIFDDLLPDAQISISREITKKFEETLRGRAKDLMQKTYKGELTVVLQ
jgi:16S rRNA (cytidine1402-2'-O)-methyltransferase